MTANTCNHDNLSPLSTTVIDFDTRRGRNVVSIHPKGGSMEIKCQQSAVLLSNAKQVQAKARERHNVYAVSHQEMSLDADNYKKGYNAL
jgi:hypothetical protein